MPIDEIKVYKQKKKIAALRAVAPSRGKKKDEYGGSVRISAYTNQSRVSHSVRMRENSAEEYPKQSSLERSV